MNHCTAASAAAAAVAAHLASVKGGLVCFEGQEVFFFFPSLFFDVDKPDWEWLRPAGLLAGKTGKINRTFRAELANQRRSG